MRNYLEYRRLPDWLVPAVVHSLLGVLHIRWVLLHSACMLALSAWRLTPYLPSYLLLRRPAA